jgi:HEAT repeat protein
LYTAATWTDDTLKSDFQSWAEDSLIPVLIPILTDYQLLSLEYDLRSRAAYLLGAIRSQLATSALIEILPSDDTIAAEERIDLLRTGCRHTVGALGHIGDAAAVSALEDARQTIVSYLEEDHRESTKREYVECMPSIDKALASMAEI